MIHNSDMIERVARAIIRAEATMQLSAKDCAEYLAHPVYGPPMLATARAAIEAVYQPDGADGALASSDSTALINKIQAMSAGYTLEAALKAHILTLSLTIACGADILANADEMIESVAVDLKHHVRLNWDFAKAAMYDQDRGGRA